jgi:hypothetical protein
MALLPFTIDSNEVFTIVLYSLFIWTPPINERLKISTLELAIIYWDDLSRSPYLYYYILCFEAGRFQIPDSGLHHKGIVLLLKS